MRRRRNDGLIIDLAEVAATLPWWVAVTLAVIAYVVLHFYATKGLAYLGQYLLPMAFLAGAAASVAARHKRGKLVSDVLKGRPASTIRDMRWQEFELLVGEGFRLQGFLVTETGGGGADGGVDMVLQKGQEKFLVQCKHWRALKVDVTTVRELYGVVAATGAAGGFLVTSGEFTPDAAAFASGCNLQLVNGAKLGAMLEKAKATLTMPPRIEPYLGAGKPPCPRCRRPMLERIAKQGSNAGKSFWGCPAFPDCRGTLPIG